MSRSRRHLAALVAAVSLLATSLLWAGKKDEVEISTVDGCKAAISDKAERYECTLCVSLTKKRDYIFDTKKKVGYCNKNVVIVITSKSKCAGLSKDERDECKKCVREGAGSYLYDTKENEGECHPNPR